MSGGWGSIVWQCCIGLHSTVTMPRQHSTNPQRAHPIRTQYAPNTHPIHTRYAPDTHQAQARRELGEDVTLFERIHDGLGAVAKGDVVRLVTKPQIVGKVLWFLVPRVVHAEGCYSHGKVRGRTWRCVCTADSLARVSLYALHSLALTIQHANPPTNQPTPTQQTNR